MLVDAEDRTELPADSELVSLAVAGDSGAFDALFRRHFPKVFNLALKITGDREDSTDIAQQAFIRTYHALKRMRDGQSFVKFVYQSTINLTRDRARRAARKPWISFGSLFGRDSDARPSEPEFQGRESDPFQSAVGASQQEALEQAIRSLPEEFREAVILHHMQGLDIAEVASVLGIPEGTAKSRLGRARQRLRNSLRPWFEGEIER